jgi:site-specific recombinase XerD
MFFYHKPPPPPPPNTHTVLKHVFAADTVYGLVIPILKPGGTLDTSPKFRDITQWNKGHVAPRAAPLKVKKLTQADLKALPWLQDARHILNASNASRSSEFTLLRNMSLLCGWRKGECLQAQHVTELIRTKGDIDNYLQYLHGHSCASKRLAIVMLQKVLKACEAAAPSNAAVMKQLTAYTSALSKELRRSSQLGKDQQTDATLLAKGHWITMQQFQDLSVFVRDAMQDVAASPSYVCSLPHALFIRDVMVLRIAYAIGMQRSEIWINAELSKAPFKLSHKPAVVVVPNAALGYKVMIHREKNQKALDAHRQLLISGEFAEHLSVYIEHVLPKIVSAGKSSVLFPSPGGKKMTSPQFQQRLSYLLFSLLGVHANPRTLRHVMESHFMAMVDTKEDIRSIATKFGNESQTAALSYRVPVHSQTADGWHPVFKAMVSQPTNATHFAGEASVVEPSMQFARTNMEAVLAGVNGMRQAAFSDNVLLAKRGKGKHVSYVLPVLASDGNPLTPLQWRVLSDAAVFSCTSAFRVTREVKFRRDTTPIACPAVHKVLDCVLATRHSISSKAQLLSSLRLLVAKIQNSAKAETVVQLFPQLSESVQQLEESMKDYSTGTLRNTFQAASMLSSTSVLCKVVPAQEEVKLKTLTIILEKRYAHYRAIQGKGRVMQDTVYSSLPQSHPIHHIHLASVYQVSKAVLQDMAAFAETGDTEAKQLAFCQFYQRLLVVCLYLAVAPLSRQYYGALTTTAVEFDSLTNLPRALKFKMPGKAAIAFFTVSIPAELALIVSVFINLIHPQLVQAASSSLFTGPNSRPLCDSTFSLFFRRTFAELWGRAVPPLDIRVGMKSLAEHISEHPLTSPHCTELRNRLQLSYTTAEAYEASRAAAQTPLPEVSGSRKRPPPTSCWDTPKRTRQHTPAAPETQTDGTAPATAEAMDGLGRAAQTPKVPPVPRVPKSDTARDSTEGTVGLLKFFSNHSNSCLEDSFVAALAASTYRHEFPVTEADPIHVQVLCNAIKSLREYWDTGDVQALKRGQESVSQLRQLVRDFVQPLQHEDSQFSAPALGEFMEAANWLRCWGVMPVGIASTSFSRHTTCSLLFSSVCTRGHIISGPVRGSGGLHFLTPSRAAGATQFWYVEPVGLGLDGVSTSYGQEGAVQPCQSCGQDAMVTWKMEHPPLCLIAEVGSLTSHCSYSNEPFLVDFLGTQYMLCGVIQNRSNSHFRCISNIRGSWHVCDDIPSTCIPVPAPWTAHTSSAWVDVIHVFSQVGKSQVQPIDAKTVPQQEIAHRIKRTQEGRTLQGMCIAVQRLLYGEKADKEGAMKTLTSDYHLTEEEIHKVVNMDLIKKHPAHKRNIILSMGVQLMQLAKTKQNM